MPHHRLLANIHQYFLEPSTVDLDQIRRDFENFLALLESGELRAAEKIDGLWKVNEVVKEGILVGFRLGSLQDCSSESFSFSELDTYLPSHIPMISRRIRIVPGGNSIRRGAYLAEKVIMMPPAFVNVGAYVGEGTMIDSHALVGSCAQIGSHVHLSAGVQIGGVLEPIGQTPVIVENGAMIGGNCGLFEGVRVGKNAVIAPGCNITASTPLYDVVHEKIYRSTENTPLTIPENAVVIMGTRGMKSYGEFCSEHKLHIPAAIIIKYRDSKTDAKVAFEELLR